MTQYSQDLNETVNEAINVRQELENIMQEAIGISATIVNEFDDKLRMANNENINTVANFTHNQNNNEDKMTIAEEKSESIGTVEPEKIRVYELARKINMSSKELLNIINDLGIRVHNHMNMLNEEQVRLIKQVIDKPLNSNEDTAIVKSSHSEMLPEEPNKTGHVLDLLIGDMSKIQPDGWAESRRDDEILQLPEEDDYIGEPELGFSITKIKSAHPYLAVKTLHDKGYSVREIAKLLDRGQGEVSLILNIAKRKQAVV